MKDTVEGKVRQGPGAASASLTHTSQLPVKTNSSISVSLTLNQDKIGKEHERAEQLGPQRIALNAGGMPTCVPLPPHPRSIGACLPHYPALVIRFASNASRELYELIHHMPASDPSTR